MDKKQVKRALREDIRDLIKERKQILREIHLVRKELEELG